jgi:long-subunit acyl-CoA synthetase (AMP-forming)
MHENGTLSIVGRSKDMIVRGGENIYPTEIEQFLIKHAEIQDVYVRCLGLKLKTSRLISPYYTHTHALPPLIFMSSNPYPSPQWHREKGRLGESSIQKS